MWRRNLDLSVVCLLLALPVGFAGAGDLPAPVTDADYYDNGAPSANRVQLGRQLFFDKILSGNKNIACASCHHPYMHSSDSLSLGVGEGGQFHATMRTTGSGSAAIVSRIGRNAPALFNLGAKEFTRLNLGGVNEQTPTGLRLLSGRFTPAGIANVLAGQALFPLVSSNEMLGQLGENDAVNTAQGAPGSVAVFPAQWDVLVRRVRAIPGYVTQFRAAFSDVTTSDKITIVHVVNAIAAFQAAQFRSDNSPFDRYLRGEVDALSAAQVRGMNLFYGAANCASCHSGKFQTDQNFHAIAMPQFGPGAPTLGALAQEDLGRHGVTQLTADKFKFRTPSLRNVALTPPYGHTGAFASLDAVVRHHLDPVTSFNSWNRGQVIMPSRSDLDQTDFAIMDNPARTQAILAANELAPAMLAENDIKDILDFLNALTDPNMIDMRRIIPLSVPSGLPVGD